MSWLLRALRAEPLAPPLERRYVARAAMTPDEKILHDFEVFGWHVVKVVGDSIGPAFAFTIGLSRRFGHPELIMFGLPLDVMHSVLNLAGDAIKAGRRYEQGAVASELLEGHSCRLLPFPRAAYRDFLGYACWFYQGDEFEALQCVWPDRAGRYPWARDAPAEFKAQQPVLGAYA